MTFKVHKLQFNPIIGGVLALHKLEKNIKSCGGIISEDADVTIYPEVTRGNPDKKKAVRWLLNKPGVMGRNQSASWNKDDLICTYATSYAKDFSCMGLLRAYEFGFDYWKDEGNTRADSCFIVRKGHQKELNQHTQGIHSLDGYKSNQELKHCFNKYQTFISYDDQTALSYQAAMCGCDSIVIPNPQFTAEEWRTEFPYLRYGIAYGHDDVQYARETRGRIMTDWLNDLERESLKETEEFIKKTEEWYENR